LITGASAVYKQPTGGKPCVISTLLTVDNSAAECTNITHLKPMSRLPQTWLKVAFATLIHWETAQKMYVNYSLKAIRLSGIWIAQQI
jgi:hypothetical protein